MDNLFNTISLRNIKLSEDPQTAMNLKNYQLSIN